MVHGRSTKIISMIKWIRTSRLSVKNSLSGGQIGNDAELFEALSLLPLLPEGGPSSVLELRLVLSRPSSPSSDSSWVVRSRRARVQLSTLRECIDYKTSMITD